METSGNFIKEIIENEIDNNSIAAEDIYLAGYSQGGRMVWHTAFGQLDQAIGGYFPIAAAPHWPAFGAEWSDTEEFLTFEGSSDMNFFIFMGENDGIFTPDEVVEEYELFIENQGLDVDDIVTYSVIAEDVGHDQDSRFFDVMMEFINDGTVASISDFEAAEWSEEVSDSDIEKDDEGWSGWEDKEWVSDDEDKDGSDDEKSGDDEEESDGKGMNVLLVVGLLALAGGAAYFFLM